MADLCETNIIGKGVRQSGIIRSRCPALDHRNINSVGHAEITGDYQVVRLNPTFEHITVCSRGSGLGLFRGRWRPFRQGQAVLSPIGAPHGARSDPTRKTAEPWQLVWITFRRGSPRRFSVSEATWIPAAYEGIQSAVEGLEREYLQDPIALHHWVELVYRYVSRLLAEGKEDPRLAPLWEKIARQPALPWTLERMAKTTGVCSGHLRRMCRAALGFGPREQLARLRIKHAAWLLSSTQMKVEQVAAEVGYSDAFAFSAAFRRVTGHSPRDERKNSCRL